MADDEILFRHGAKRLPEALVDSYNVDIKARGEILNHRVRNGAFIEIVDRIRREAKTAGDDPLGSRPTEDLGKKYLGGLLQGDEPEPAAVVQTAIDAFADDMATTLAGFLKDRRWKGVARIAVGGGFREGVVGERTIAAAALRLKAAGIGAELVPIAHHPDEAGLIGAAHLLPRWMFKGHDAILGVDIGGSNIRAGVVQPELKAADDLSEATVWKSELWRHADETVRRTGAVESLIEMLESLIARARKEELRLAPFIGIGCPGVIHASGTITRGGMNLPGGNWDDARFNLPKVISAAIPKIAGSDTVIVMHNDAVLQGLSQRPLMADVKRWGVITIGTGLGNAAFTNPAE